MHLRLPALLSRITWIVLTTLLLIPLHAELRVGDDRLTVLKTLGEPNGRIEMGTLERLFFDRGEIRLREGLVSEIDLISETAAQARRDQQAREAKARRERGEALKAERLADPDFRARPATRRYAFWRDFRREFPEVDVFAQYTDAKADAEQAAERQRTAERLANVERRVADAEFRAQRAETTARTFNTPTRIQYVTPYPILYQTRQHTHGRRHPHYPPHPQTRPPQKPSTPGLNIRIVPPNRSFTTSGGIITAEPMGGLSTAEPLSGFSFQR